MNTPTNQTQNETWPSAEVLIRLEPRLGAFFSRAALEDQARSLGIQVRALLATKPELARAYAARDFVDFTRGFTYRLLLAARMNKLEELESR